MFNLIHNPNPGHDYTITLNADITQELKLFLTYIPDHHLLETNSLKTYLKSLDQDIHLATHTLHRVLNNELLPRWIRIEVSRDTPLKECVVIEDQQPGFSN